MAADGVRVAGFGRRRFARRPWAAVPAGLICAALICVVLAAAHRSGLGGAFGTLSLALEEHLHTQPPLAPARVAAGPRGRDIRLAGELGEGTAERLRAVLAAHPDATRIHLTSEGGLVEEALAIGDLIAARRLATYVPDYCVSACTLAFVRGTRRHLVANGRLGFHAPYDPGLFGQVVQADAAAERTAYLAAGVEPGFVSQALATASDSLWIPEAARLVEARVVTDLVGTDRFPDSTLDDDPSPAGARAAILRALPLMGALDGRGGEGRGSEGRDDRLASMAADYLDGYQAGISEAEALNALRARARTAIAGVLRGADDAAWVEIGHFFLRGMRRADPEACRAIGGTGDLLAAQEVLGDAAARALLARAAGQGGTDVTRLPTLARVPRDCAGLIAAYTRAFARPGAGATLRALAGQGRPPAREASALPH